MSPQRPGSPAQRREEKNAAYWKGQFDRQKARGDEQKVKLLGTLKRAEAMLTSVLGQHDLLPSETLSEVRAVIRAAEVQ